MLTYVDWTPGRWGRVQTELLCPCGLPVLYLTARMSRRGGCCARSGGCGGRGMSVAPSCRTRSRRVRRYAGIADPDETALRRALLTPLLRALTGAEDGARIPAVLLSAPAASPAVYAAAEELAHAARRLLLDVGAGQEDLSDYLRRRFGLCAGGASPDAEVCFGERKGSAPALFLGHRLPRAAVGGIRTLGGVCAHARPAPAGRPPALCTFSGGKAPDCGHWREICATQRLTGRGKLSIMQCAIL